MQPLQMQESPTSSTRNVLTLYRCSACRCVDRDWSTSVPEQPLPPKTLERDFCCLDVACSCHTANGGKNIQAKIFDWTEVPY